METLVRNHTDNKSILSAVHDLDVTWLSAGAGSRPGRWCSLQTAQYCQRTHHLRCFSGTWTVFFYYYYYLLSILESLQRLKKWFFLFMRICIYTIPWIGKHFMCNESTGFFFERKDTFFVTIENNYSCVDRLIISG